METKVTRLSQISNKIFLIISIFFFSFIWTEYYLHSIKKAIIFSIPISLTIILAYTLISRLINKKREKTKASAKSKEEFRLQLLLSHENIINPFLLGLLDYSVLDKLDDNHYILDKEREVYIYFDEEMLDQTKLNNIIRRRKTNHIIIFCNTSDTTLYPENIEIEIFDINKIYSLSNERNQKLTHSINFKKKPRYRIKDILCIILNRDKSKKYLYGAILLIITSLFTPYNNYYIIISSILLMLSIYSRFNTRFN